VNRLPDRLRPEEERPVPQLSSQQFEMVIRRAAELQARSAEEPGSEIMAEDEALRIGRELGLSDRHLSQALAEVRSAPKEESGFLSRAIGEAVIACSRTVPGNADAVRALLENYLLEHEFMVVLRRLPGRTVYVKARGVLAVIGLSTKQLFNRSPPLALDGLELSVQPLEEGYSFVTISTDLSGKRAGYAAGGVAVGGTMTGMGSLALAIAIAPPAAVLALPVLGIAAIATRGAYAANARKIRVQLESLLDRLEHGELPKSKPGWKRTGF
jgi:hypothetical protein